MNSATEFVLAAGRYTYKQLATTTAIPTSNIATITREEGLQLKQAKALYREFLSADPDAFDRRIDSPVYKKLEHITNLEPKEAE